VLRAEGKLIGPWVEELEKCWRSTTNGAAGKCIRLDLEGVTFSDQNAKALLVKMFEDGVELRAGGPMMNSLVGEITSRSARSRGKYFSATAHARR